MGVPQFPSSERFSGLVGGPWVGLGGVGVGGLASPDLGNHRQHNCHSSSHPSTGIHYSPASHHHAIHTITGIIAVSHQICCTPHPSSPNGHIVHHWSGGPIRINIQSNTKQRKKCPDPETQSQTQNREKQCPETQSNTLFRSGGAIGKIVASYFKPHLITSSSPHQTNLHQKYSIAHNAKVTAQKTQTLSASPPTPLLPTKYSKRIQKAWTG